MTTFCWSLLEASAQILKRDEREAVLGDLEEGGVPAWRALFELFGLIVRRELAVWNSWRPWLASFGLALPASFLLMGSSVSTGWAWRQLIYPQMPAPEGLAAGYLFLLWHIVCLIACSWTSGFVVGSMSRRTLWVSILCCCAPCLFCLARFRAESLSPLCLFLFLAPAIWGVWQGLRTTRIKLGPAIVLATAVTIAIIPIGRGRSSSIGTALIWPAWYMVATARRTARET